MSPKLQRRQADPSRATDVPQEYAAFRNLLRQVVKPEPKRPSAPSSSGKG
jgi:hypothetical protein